MSKEINFEESMKDLEQIANDLEKGDLDLELSMQKFEQGMKIAKDCNEILEKAEKKITMLISDSKGELTETDFVQSEE